MTATTPTLATFVRDRLAEWLDGLGHIVTDTDDRDGFPCLTTESWDGSTVEDVAVTSDGRTFSMVDGWREVRLRGFVWVAEPTDTGRVHGPVAPLRHERGALRRRLRGGAYRLYADAMALGIDPVPAGATFGYRDAHDALRIDTGAMHGPTR